MSLAAPSREGQGSGNETSGSGADIWPLGGGAAAPAASTSGGGGAGGGGDTNPPPPPPPSTMPFAEENGVDPEDVATKADTIKVPYDKKDPVYWFQRLAIQMRIRKIQSQFWKRIVLEANLPPEVNETIKDLLIKEENDAGTVYKDCKARLLKVFGPKPEQDVTLAMGLTLIGSILRKISSLPSDVQKTKKLRINGHINISKGHQIPM